MAFTGTSLEISLVLDRFTPASWLRSGRISSATVASCARAPPFPRVERWGRPAKVRRLEWISTHSQETTMYLSLWEGRLRLSQKPLNISGLRIVLLALWRLRKNKVLMMWRSSDVDVVAMFILQNFKHKLSRSYHTSVYIVKFFNPTWGQTELQVLWSSDCLRSNGCEEVQILGKDVRTMEFNNR